MFREFWRFSPKFKCLYFALPPGVSKVMFQTSILEVDILYQMMLIWDKFVQAIQTFTFVLIGSYF